MWNPKTWRLGDEFEQKKSQDRERLRDVPAADWQPVVFTRTSDLAG
jgi:hypothetical protein